MFLAPELTRSLGIEHKNSAESEQPVKSMSRFSISYVGLDSTGWNQRNWIPSASKLKLMLRESIETSKIIFHLYVHALTRSFISHLMISAKLCMFHSKIGIGRSRKMPIL